MTVLDASVLVDVLLLRPGAPDAVFLASRAPLHAPHLLDLEVTQTLRRLARTGFASPRQVATARDAMHWLPLRRHGHHRLLGRIWELREVLTAYDAAYLALAEALACPLLTRDAALAAAPGARVPVELV